MPEEQIIDITKVSDKGQVVIPKAVRDKLGMTEGSKLIVIATDDAVILQKIELVGGRMRIREIVDRVRSIKERLALGKGN